MSTTYEKLYNKYLEEGFDIMENGVDPYDAEMAVTLSSRINNHDETTIEKLTRELDKDYFDILDDIVDKIICNLANHS